MRGRGSRSVIAPRTTIIYDLREARYQEKIFLIIRS
jgi:hypothetical protein